ncbi:O-antigen ligase family protein [Mahella sp.]|uniref:O-antigen ligase family protein n=1 Tax=Mahella sp. TaxID=2798721 RepID=UPI0025BB2932|nr:O-antigen ligase family protein [Mahella sp.]MBZ4664883.1 O-antigen polymerase [Mahella sp.]
MSIEIKERPLNTAVTMSEFSSKPDIYDKYMYYNVIALVLGILSPYTAPLMVAFISVQYIIRKIKSRDIDLASVPLAQPYMLMFIAVLISDIYSPDFIEIIATVGFMLPYVIYGIYTEEVFDKHFAMHMVSLIAWTSLPVSLFGIVQKILSDNGILFYLPGGRLASTFVNANLYAFYLAVVIFVTLGYMFYTTGEKKRRALMMVLCLDALNLYLTNSRTALFSVLIAAIFFFLLCGKRHAAHILFMSAFILMMAIIVYPQLIPRYFVLDESMEARKEIWQTALVGIRYSPIIGRGFLSFMDFSAMFGVGQLHAHNIVLNTWFEWGVLGVISIIWYVVALFKRGLSALRDSPHRPVIAGILAAVIAAFIQSMTDNPVVNIQTGLIFIMLASILVALTPNNACPTAQKKV